MAELMDECNICITAASTVLYECCARCLPTLFVIAAKDQKYDAKYFSMDDMMLYCGDYLNDKIEALEKILQNLKLIIEDKDLQKKMKMKMEKFTDGYGAKRIADELMKL